MRASLNVFVFLIVCRALSLSLGAATVQVIDWMDSNITILLTEMLNHT